MYVYVIGSSDGPQKIGISKHPDIRLKNLQVSHMHPLTVQFSHKAADESEARKVEMHAHAILWEKRLHGGEWFSVSPSLAIQSVKTSIEAVARGEKRPTQIVLGMISPAQIRAGRALLGWTQARLAKACSVSLMAIRNIETEHSHARAVTLDGIKAALESGGVVFTAATSITGPGVAPRAT